MERCLSIHVRALAALDQTSQQAGGYAVTLVAHQIVNLRVAVRASAIGTQLAGAWVLNGEWRRGAVLPPQVHCIRSTR
jgi:hypothetical protein